MNIILWCNSNVRRRWEVPRGLGAETVIVRDWGAGKERTGDAIEAGWIMAGAIW